MEKNGVVAEANLTELTAAIVASFVAHNVLAPTEMPDFILAIHAALATIDRNDNAVSGVRPTPAVPIHESITPDYLVCLEDGRKLKVLKRYLRRKYSLSPDQYREKWHLPPDYPMVAPAYAELRSAIAKRSATPSEASHTAKRAKASTN